MPNRAHKNLDDDDGLHEPKGVASASAGQVYRADSGSSGAWEAPLKLIERRALSGATSEIFTGLTPYRLILVSVEQIEFSDTTARYLLLQVYAGAYRTTTYINSYMDHDVDTVNPSQTGFVIGTNSNHTDACKYGWGTAEISNFNVAYPTSFKGGWAEQNVNQIDSPTAATVYNRYATMGIYPTAEAHTRLKFLASDGDTMSNGYITLWGIY